MYLAFKWLILLAVAMWVCLCFIHMQISTHPEKHTQIPSTDYSKVLKDSLAHKNQTVLNETESKKFKKKFRVQDQWQIVAIVHYFTFFAGGALVVTLFHRKNEIILFAKRKVSEIDFRNKATMAGRDFKITAKHFSAFIVKLSISLWEKSKLQLSSLSLQALFSDNSEAEARKKRNELLLKRLKEVGLERNKLSQLLVTAIHENKNIRLQFQLENLAKNRLMRQIQDIQKQIKEHRSKHVNFQQLYLVTHQENSFLKSRIKKLSSNKEEAEANLMALVNRVFQSTDNSLKAYCTCFIVKTRENVLPTDDVKDKPSEFLHKSYSPGPSTSNKSPCVEENVDMPNIWPSMRDDNDCVPFESEEPKPKLRGLPGEYVWTVKDREGIIEKLYEYGYGYDYDHGDVIRRIREYTVYHDKDCLLDLAKSTTIIHDRSFDSQNCSPRCSQLDLPTRKNFLTESPVFQKFLQNTKNVTALSPPPLLYT